MARVTIEGSVTPSVLLPRGHRMTIERTEVIDKMMRRGFGVVVEEHTPAPVIASITDVVTMADVATEPAPVPARNASREVWAAFLVEEGVPHEIGAPRDALIAAWDAAFPDGD